MGFFNELGKKAEKLKQQATSATKEEATHGCAECETLLYSEHEKCPECGSDSVVTLSDG